MRTFIIMNVCIYIGAHSCWCMHCISLGNISLYSISWEIFANVFTIIIILVYANKRVSAKPPLHQC